MASEKNPGTSFPPPASDMRNASPPPSQQIRQRPLSRSATFGYANKPLNRRRSSLFSENVSETHNSLRSSTDDLLLPRVTRSSILDSHHESSHWTSVPLGLALMPAVGGLFFHNGNAVVTDITLLALAAIFLNWSVRLPWDWYLSAQSQRVGQPDPLSVPSFDSIIEEENETEGPEHAVASSQESTPPKDLSSKPRQSGSSEALKAGSELRLHELLALLACFISPAVGAWLLHTIRAQLSRPSEGLVSDYNLTVFLLASEIRPMSHLVKLVQARTLYLQRIVHASVPDEDEKPDSKFLDLANRLDELEAYTANSKINADKKAAGSDGVTASQLSAQATSEVRRSLQPELDALNRAVRRYEKRTTISAIQIETRLQDLEKRVNSVVVLAAAAQRNTDTQSRGFIIVLVNWMCAAVVVPIQYALYLSRLPPVAVQWARASVIALLGFKKTKDMREPKSGKQSLLNRTKDRRTRGTA